MIESLDIYDEADDNQLSDMLLAFEAEMAKPEAPEVAADIQKAIDAILADQVTKAYQRKFSTKTEAAQHAARVRWGNRRASDDPMEQLKTSVGELQTLLASVTEDDLTAADDNRPIMSEYSATNILSDDQFSNLLAFEAGKDLPDPGETMMGPKAMRIEAATTAVGNQALAIAKGRLAERGITPESCEQRKADLDNQARENMRTSRQLATHPGSDSAYAGYQRNRRIERGEITATEAEAEKADYANRKKALKASEKELKAQYQTPEADYGIARSQEALALIAEVRGTGVAPEMVDVGRFFGGQPAKPVEIKAMQSGVARVFPAEFVERANKDFAPQLQMRVGVGPGGSFSLVDNKIEIEMGQGSTTVAAFGTDKRSGLASIFTHEYGHFAANWVPGVAVAEQAFYHRRTRGLPSGASAAQMATTKREPILSAMSSGMFVRPDQFGMLYAGRDYSPAVKNSQWQRNLRPSEKKGIGRRSFHATETLSTGMEALLGARPDARKLDDDHFAFTLGVVMGLK